MVSAAALLLAGAFFTPAHAQTLLPNWNQLSPATSPPARWDGAQAYDAAHRQVVMFGGLGAGTLNDTWLWNGTNWTQASPATIPDGRANQAMAYDAATGQVVMFGGIDSSNTRLGDTWLWNGTNWTEASPANSPPARDGAAMVYDAALGEIVLFGGLNTGGTVQADTWLWNGTNWSQAIPANSPTGRFNHAMAYDAAHGQVILFGGFNGIYLNDTWVWNGTNWLQEAPAASPGARYGAGMDYDAALGQVVMFGGYDGSGYYDETWTWNGNDWIQQSPALSPSASYATNVVTYDAAQGGLVMFGGYSGDTSFSDTWVFGTSQNFGNVNVCPSGHTAPAPCNNTMPVVFNFTAGSTTVNSIQVLTQGASNLDFAIAQTAGTNCINTISAGGSCTVLVTFTPQAPGLRQGAVELLDNSGNLLVTAPIYGNGQAPAVAFGPATTGTYPNVTYSNQVTTVPTLTGYSGITTDALGNLYHLTGPTLLKLPPPYNATPTTVATGFTAGYSVAIDGAGNFYVADPEINTFGEVLKLTPGCTSATASCASVIYAPSSHPGPIAVAVDRTGNVFIAQNQTGVFEIPANGGPQFTLYNPPGNSLGGMAVDAAGDLFVTDSGNKHVVEIPAGCTTTGCQTLIGSGWASPQDVAVDAAGDVIVADVALTIGTQIDAGGVVEVPAGCTTAGCQILLWTSGGASDPSAVAITSTGQIFFVTDGTPVYEINQSLAPSLSFDTTYVGFTSDDSPKSITFQNIGNQTLSAVAPGVAVTDPDFSLAGSGPGNCSATFSLNPGADCNLSISFAPLSAGSFNGNATFTDNALNNPPAVQAVPLSGGGLNSVQTLTVIGAGAGNGSVTSNPTGIQNCTIVSGVASGTCSAGFPGGTVVLLQEIPSSGFVFTGWGNACANYGTQQTCQLTLNSTASVTASFAPVALNTLTVTEVGTGSGTVSDASQISCMRANGSTTGTCSANYAGPVILTATASGNSTFAGWGGACAGSGTSPTCSLTVSSPLNVTASFVAPGASQAGLLKPITAGVVYGQGGSFTTGTQNKGGVSANSLNLHAGLAVDGSGNLYVADAGNNRVLFYPAGSTTATRVYGQGGSFNTNDANHGGISADSLSNPQNVVVDSSGNLYVADQSNNRVLFYPVGTTTATRVYGQNGNFTTNSANSDGVSATTLAQPYGLALDSTGNLYVTDYLNSRVLFYPAGNTTATQVYGQNGSFTANSMNNGGLGANSLYQPTGVAVDASGDLYVADIYNNRVLFYPYNSTTATKVYGQPGFTTNSANNGGISANSLNNPMAIALDSSGNLYVADRSNNRVLFYLFGSTTATRVYGQSNSFTTANNGGVTANSLSQPWAVALDNGGNLYVSDYSNNRVLEYGPVGNVNVCPAGQATPAPCSTTITLAYSPASPAILGATQVVTQGAAGLDFTLSTGNTCTGALAAGSSCTVNATFTPLAPGLRTGAVTLYNSTGSPITTTLLQGIGEAPLAAFSPSAQVPVSTGTYSLAHPAGVLVDNAGNLFISDVTNKEVLKIASNGTVSTVGSGFQFPQGMAEDGAGNLYVADNNLNEIVEIPAGCASSSCQVYLGSNYRSQLGVAVDGAGNVFFGDFLDGKAVEIPAGCTSITCQKVVYNPGQGAQVVDLTVDSMGNLFVADYGRKLVVEVPAGCINSSCQIAIGSGWSQPDGVAVDAAGDVFVADEGLHQIVEVPAGCTTFPCQVMLVNNVDTVAVKVDASGDLFYDNLTTAQIAAVTRSLPPSVGFALTNVGSTSGPQPVSVQNIGNQTLTGSSSFNLGAAFSVVSTCGPTLSLLPGAVCSESFGFLPQTTGYLTGSASFSDNTMNLSPAVSLQTISLSGIGGLNGQAVTAAVPNVVGLTLPAAGASLVGAGLVTGSVSTASSSIVPAGSVIASNPAAGTQVNLGSQVKLLISSGAGQPAVPNPLSLLNNYFVTGDYAAAGVTLRGATVVNNMVTGTINIPSSSGPGTPGVPTGADLIDGFLYWTTLESSALPSGSNAIFLGYPVSGQQIGSDLPYTDPVVSASGTLRVYRADVNTWFQNGSNGIRTGSGNFTVSLPAGGAKGVLLTEGASLVVIYRVLSPNFPLKAVVIYDGSAIPASSTTQNIQGFYDAAGGGNANGEVTTIFADSTGYNSNTNVYALGGQTSQYNASLNANSAYSAVIFSTTVNNPDNDGILGAWKTGPPATDFHGGQPGYYDVKTGTWVGLPGAKAGQKDLFVQLDYMCGALLGDGSCDPGKENLFPSPDSFGNDPLAMVQQAFANAGVALHLQVGNAVAESTCTDSPGQPCQFPSEPGVIGWKNSLEFSKVWPRNFASCVGGGDCSPRFPYGQKDSYHYVLFGHSLAIPAWNTRYATLTSINAVAGGTTTFVTTNRGAPGSINYCPSRITVSGIQGMPGLNGVYNTTSCPDADTMIIATPAGVTSWTYPNSTLPEPVIGITSGTVTSISGYSDLGGADSAVTLGLWETSTTQDMSKKATVIAGTLFHELGHTIGLSHGGLYYDTPGSYVPTFEANCKPNYQSIMNYLFQLDGVGPASAIAYSNQTLVGQTLSTLSPLTQSSFGSVTALVDTDLGFSGAAATFPTSTWYTPTAPSTTASAAIMHCDGTPLTGDVGYRVDGSIAPIAPAWANGQNITFDGQAYSTLRGFNDLSNIDLRQVGATGGQFASLASVLSFDSSATPLNIAPGGSVAVGPGGTVTLGAGGSISVPGGNVTVPTGGMISGGGTITFGTGGNVTLGAGGNTILTAGSNGIITLPAGGNVTLGGGGTITLGGGGNVTLGAGGNVTLGAGGTITLPGSGGTITIPSTGGSYFVPTGGTVTLGGGGNITLGAGGNVTLGAGGNVTLGAGGNVTLGGGGNVTLGAGGTITLGSSGNVTLGGGGNITLGAGGNITLGGGGNVTLGAGGNVTLGGGGTVTLGGGGNITLGGGGNVTLGAGGTVTLGAGGNVTLGAGGNVTLGGGGNVTLGAGGTITLTAAGNVTLGAGGGTINGVADGPGTYPVAAGGTIILGAGGNVTLGGGGNVTLGAGGNITLGGGGTVTLGGGGNVTLGAGGNVTLGAGGNITLGGGGNITLGGGGNVTLGGGGATANELDYNTANSIVRPPTAPTETSTTQGVVVNWTAPGFGVVDTYTIFRSVNGGTPVVLGSVSGVGGNPPATTFTDTNPPTSGTVAYTISTTLAPDPGTSTQRQSAPSSPAVMTIDQTIVLTPLPSSVPLSTSTIQVTATAQSNGSANHQLVNFAATGPCSAGPSSLDTATGTISSGTVTLTGTGSCTITASQSGDSTNIPVVSPAYNPADPVSGTFMIVPQGSNLNAQTINFPQLPNAQYGNSPVSVNATATPTGFTITFTTSGPCSLAGGNTIAITGAGKCSVTASAPSGVGSDSKTYSAASSTQSFNIAPAVLTVKAGDQTISYGQSIPSLTNDYTITGYVNSETSAVLNNTAPAISTTATSASAPGPYPITVSTGNLAATNYSFLYVPGTLTIQQATATISINNIPMNAVYNGSFTPTYSYSGTGIPTESTTSSTTTVCTVLSNGSISFVGVGTCTLTASATATADNSAVTGAPQSFQVGMATATISISNIPMNAVYNGTFTPTYAYSGTGTPTESTTSTTTTVCTVTGGAVNFVGVGTCTLTAKATATTDNLAATGNPQSFSVGKASQAITFTPASPVTYGVSPITLAATSTSHLAVALTIDASSTAPATISGSTVTIKGAGNLVLDANQVGNVDYAAAPQVQRTIVVNQAILTVTANSLTRAYGAANPTLTVTYSGFVNPDGPSVLTGSPSLSTTAIATSLPGPYPITVTQGSLAAANYTFKFVNGTLTVTYTGSVPSSSTTCNGAYNGTFKGSLVISKGQTCIFVAGGTTGSVTDTGGNLVLQGATIGGSVTITSGAFTIGPSTTIKGNLTIASLPKSTTTNQVCGSTITSSLVFQSNGAAVLIGSGTPSCAGNIIQGSLQVASNSAAVTMEGNKVSGSIQVQSNSGATIIDGNTVGVSLQDQSNTGATQVFTNVIANALQCQSNTSITGGGNTAPTKQGQCAKF